MKSESLVFYFGYTGRPSCEGRGLKFDLFFIGSRVFKGSSLMRGTWIEIFASTNHLFSSRSSLMRGTWIEIVCPAEPAGFHSSSLMRGTWIEIFERVVFLYLFSSSLMRGTWIEILEQMRVVSQLLGRPSCEGRGLKSPPALRWTDTK